MMRLGVTILLLSISSFASTNNLGQVEFRTSCAPAVTQDFNHAVALLHSFEYDEARDAFEDVSKKDPTCAMAKWGVAMTRFHGLWGEFNPQAGAQAVKEAQELAASNPKVTDREKAYIGAVAELFSQSTLEKATASGEHNHADSQGYVAVGRGAARPYEAKMAALHEAYPDDVEATIFYALSLDMTITPNDNHANERKCVSLLRPLFEKYPNHPGIAHYIIHCDDNPAMAAEGLDAARKYAAIAPASAHATHMPSHIFSQLGLWNEMVASNRASMKAAEAAERATPCQKVNDTLHAMYFLTFGLVQIGQLSEARKVADQARTFPASVKGGSECDEGMSTHPWAAYVLETGDWPKRKEIQISAPADSIVPATMWLAKGVAAARNGDLAQAKEAETKLGEGRDAVASRSPMGRQNMIEAWRESVAAWIEYQSGDKQRGLEQAKLAADLQDKLGGGSPMFKSSRELLADMLAEDGQHKAAAQTYEEVLKTRPNRFAAIYGVASESYKAGDAETARKFYGQLLQVASGDERPELAEARKMVGNTAAGK